MGDQDGSPKRSAPMSIGGNTNDRGGPQGNASEAGLSQSCPLKPMKLFKIPTNEPEPFALPQSINENEELLPESSAPCNIDLDDNDADTADEGPGRSFIRGEGFENISAAEFNSNVKERATFLSQSCPGPSWGDMGVMLRDFPPRQPRAQVQEEASASAAEEVHQAETQFAKLNLEADNLSELGRSPTIFESISCATVTAIEEEEEDVETICNPKPEGDTIDDEPDMAFQMDE